MHAARNRASATVLKDGRVLVVGGIGASGQTLATAEIYDPRRDRWTLVAPLASGRAGHAAVRLRDGSVLVAGGYTSPATTEPVPAERYDPSRNAWRQVGTTALSEGESALLLRDGRVILLGGMKGKGAVEWVESKRDSPAAEIYDPHNDSWSPVQVPVGLSSTAAVLSDGRVLVTASATSGVTAVSDPRVTSWTRVESWNKVAHLHHGAWVVGAAAVSEGRVLLVACGRFARAAVLYDPRAGTWKRAATPRTPCPLSSLTRVEDGRVMLLGGSDGRQLPAGATCESVGHAEIYDVSRNSWSTVPMPGTEPAMPAVAATEGYVFVIGGARCHVDTPGVDILANVERYSEEAN